jgi:hypothetical protein
MNGRRIHENVGLCSYVLQRNKRKKVLALPKHFQFVISIDKTKFRYKLSHDLSDSYILCRRFRKYKLSFCDRDTLNTTYRARKFATGFPNYGDPL